MNELFVDELILSFLKEDLGWVGDLSSRGLEDKVVKGEVLFKENGIVCGIPFFERVFRLLDSSVKFDWRVKEGEEVKEGTVLCYLEGKVKALLSGERTALNILQKLSGIATNTKRYVSLLKGSPVKLLDTRKTTPGWRVFEKYATKIGGAYNHRFGLYDAVMIKDNHVKAYGSLKEAVLTVKELIPVTASLEVEVENREQLDEVLEVLEYVDIVMLDNWPLEKVEEAVTLLKGRNEKIKVEISGGIDLDALERLKFSGVDFISTSKLITAAKWVDISMELT